MQLRTLWILAAFFLVNCATKSVYERNFTGVKADFPATSEIIIADVNGVDLATSKDLDYPDHDVIGHTFLTTRRLDRKAVAELGKRIGAEIAIVWMAPGGLSERSRGTPKVTFSDGSKLTEAPSRLERGLIQRHYYYEVAFLRKRSRGI